MVPVPAGTRVLSPESLWRLRSGGRTARPVIGAMVLAGGPRPPGVAARRAQGGVPDRYDGLVTNLATGDRCATREEVLRAREALRQLAERHGLARPRVDAIGTVVIHTDDPGYGQLRRYAIAAAKMVGVWVNVITDDSGAAQVDTEVL